MLELTRVCVNSRCNALMVNERSRGGHYTTRKVNGTSTFPEDNEKSNICAVIVFV